MSIGFQYTFELTEADQTTWSHAFDVAKSISEMPELFSQFPKRVQAQVLASDEIRPLITSLTTPCVVTFDGDRFEQAVIGLTLMAAVRNTPGFSEDMPAEQHRFYKDAEDLLNRLVDITPTFSFE